MATTPVDPRINSTTMYLPGAGFLAQTGTATPQELAAANQAAAPNNSAAYLPGGQVTYPGGTSPINPTQFATQAEADRLAQLYGGTTSQINLSGPGYSWPGQQQLNIPGAPSTLNAGLVSNTLFNNPGAYGQYLVNRDITGNYGPSAYDTHRNMDTMEATAKAYGWGPEMRVQQGLPAQAPTTQTTTPTAPTTRLSSSQIAAGQNPYLTAPTTRTPTTQTQTMNLTRTPYVAPYQGVADNNPTSNSLSRGYVSQIPATTDGGTQTTQGSDINYLDPNTDVPAPASGTIFQGSDGTFYSWNGTGWDQSAEPPPGAQQQPDGSWSYGNTPPPDTGDGSAPPPPDTGGGGGGGTTSGSFRIPGQGFAPSGGGAYPPGGGPDAPNGGYGYTPYIGGGNATQYGSNPYALPGVSGPANHPTVLMTRNGEDVNLRAESDRNMAIAEGEGLQGDLRNYTNYQQIRAGGYESAANTAYNAIAQGQGGYSDAEKAAIQNNDYLNGLQLTPEEMQGIQGDPYAAYRQLGLDESYMGDAMDSWYGGVGNAISQGDTGINNALSDAGTNVRNSVYNQRTAMRNDLSDIAALTRDQQAQAVGNVRGALDTEDAYTRQYIDPTKLTWSPEYQQNYNVTEQDMQDIRNKAGRSVGAQEAMDEQNLERQANAQGNTSPLAIEAARNRMRQTGAVNEANAMSNAQIAAKQLQLQTTQARENTRLGAETAYANLGTGSELSLGSQRTGAEQALGTQGLSNEQYMGNASLGTETTLGAAEQGAEQYLGSQQQQARQFQSSQKVAAQNTLGAANTAQEQWKTGTNLAAGQQAEGTQQARRAQIAGNRQQTGQYIYGQTAQNNTNFANQRLTAEQEYRNYLANQGNQAQQNTTIGNQQRIGTYQGQMGAQNASTSTGVQNAAIKGFGERIFDTVIPVAAAAVPHAKGGLIKGPQTALVGEAGPELIVDLKHKGGGMYGIGDDDEDDVKPMGLGGVGDPYSQQDDYAQGGGADDTPLSTDDLKPKKMAGSQLKSNPLYKQLAGGVRNAYLGPPPATSAAGGTGANDPSGGAASLGGALQAGFKGLNGGIIPNIISYYLSHRGQNKAQTPGATPDPGYQQPDPGDYQPASNPRDPFSVFAYGGVAGPGSFKGKNTGHHPYGKKGMPQGIFHSKTLGMPKVSKGMPKIPGIKLVTKPHIMKLGAKIPQAVIPLTRRPGNKVNVEDIPNLMSKYGV